MERPDQLATALQHRIAACRALPFQVFGQPHERVIDPIRGTSVLVNPRRAQRPPGDDAHCPYCEGRTPPTLCYVPAADGRGPLAPVIEREEASLAVVRRLVDSSGDEPVSPFAAVEAVGKYRHEGADGVSVPLVHPATPWVARVFLNLIPVLNDAAGREACFVVSVPPAHHADDLGVLGSWTPVGRAGSHPLPPTVVEAVVACWRLLEGWASAQGLTAIPFINGGKDRASGQSVSCFHSQVYVTGPGDEPPLYEALARRRRASGCPLCSLLGDPRLRLREFGSVAVMAHPAPERDLTWVIAPTEDVPTLGSLASPADLAAALSWAVRLYEPLLGGVPAYTLVVRTGPLVGHLHVEVVPRSRVNVPGGFESATGFAVATRDPLETAATVRALAAAGAAADDEGA
jgi:galactose-1-phosphate uridylyltransferase